MKNVPYRMALWSLDWPRFMLASLFALLPVRPQHQKTLRRQLAHVRAVFILEAAFGVDVEHRGKRAGAGGFRHFDRHVVLPGRDLEPLQRLSGGGGARQLRQQ